MASQSRAIPGLMETTVSSGNCTVENPIFTPHDMKAVVVLPKQTVHAIFTWAGGPTLLSLCLVHERHSQSENQHPPSSHHARWMVCGVWTWTRNTFFPLYSCPTATNYSGQVCTNHLHTSLNSLDSHHLPCLLAFCTE
jgi:hypothetical protein